MKTDVFFLLCFKRRWIVLEDVFWDNDQRHKIGLNIYIFNGRERGTVMSPTATSGRVIPKAEAQDLAGCTCWKGGAMGRWVDGQWPTGGCWKNGTENNETAICEIINQINV